ncbi:serine/threonine-protein kinase OSR1-like [Cynara cardunculus var. scolymus]|uniref:serine/threonine-protein kinase OSR1-like n=1 Tax=Cynara cardunculus var. scolymus TaxID=59895 RepID=UPI000D62A4C0|nr:serine/threonine-protein kinase OSR1-like [Cynara cardunculus var. scolymus]
MEKKKYPVGAEHYVLYEEIGQGVSASVFRALCIPSNEIVAIKVLDFERGNSDLNNISREAQTMILVDHPNVLKSHCSFVNDHNLWVVMPFMPGGSCLHILKSAHPEGFEEVVIATILREVLKALEYLHHHGLIHRDVKAGNILICERGSIKLGDLGVSACLFDSGDRQRTRNTFVGTPCWMAPEVMEQLHGYDFKADIWSFGITALELAHGHAPFSKYPPMKVLLMTLQNAPPGLDYERDKKFSKSFKQMIASCLVKDPSKRPSAKKLLKHSFFKQAKSNEFIARKLLEGLPTLGDRLQALKRKEEDMLVQKKIPDGQKEEMSQNEYKRGISGWNFDLEDVKAQASLIQDEESISDKDQLGNSNSFNGTAAGEIDLQHEVAYMNEASTDLILCIIFAFRIMTNILQAGSAPIVNSPAKFSAGNCEKPVDALGFARSADGHLSLQYSSSSDDNGNMINYAGKPYLDTNGKPFNCVASLPHQGEASSGCIVVEENGKLQGQIPVVRSCNGIQLLQVVDASTSESMSKTCKTTLTSDEQDEKTKCPVVQQKGRFKVTSEKAEVEKGASCPALLKSPSMRVIIQHPTVSQPSQGDTSSMPQNQTTHLLPPMVAAQQTNNLQRNGKSSSTTQLSTPDTTANSSTDGGSTPVNINGLEKSKLEAANDREKELLDEITDLHRRLLSAQEELQKYKAGNAQA